MGLLTKATREVAVSSLRFRMIGLNLLYRKMAVLYNCFRAVKGKKALLYVLKVYKPIRVSTLPSS